MRYVPGSVQHPETVVDRLRMGARLYLVPGRAMLVQDGMEQRVTIEAAMEAIGHADVLHYYSRGAGMACMMFHHREHPVRTRYTRRWATNNHARPDRRAA